MTKTLSFTSGTLVISISVLLGILSLLGTLSLPKGGFLIMFVVLFFALAFGMVNMRYRWIKFKK